jgi:hypothetical protein
MTSLEITNENKYTLIATSIFSFCFPSIFLLYNKCYLHGVCALLAGLVSILYWSDPSNTVCYMLDICVSRACTTFYIISLFKISYQLSIEHTVSSIIFVMEVIYFYLKSKQTYNLFDRSWVIYHSIFHIFCCISILFWYFVKEMHTYKNKKQSIT